MTKPETDAEFLERALNDVESVLSGTDLRKLKALADRGAKIPDDPTDAMIDAGIDVSWHQSVSRIYRAMLTTALKDTDNKENTNEHA